ncbi:acetyl-CoA synthetase-like protein, partial [Aspergillus ellipticus CBS 707.79]
MASPPATPRKLWDHPNPNATQMAQFKRSLESTNGVTLPDFHSLYQWSIANRAAFWDFCWKYFPIVHEGTYSHVVDESARIDSNPDWFPGVRLNFAENLLFSRGAGSTTTTVGKEDTKVAVTEVREGAAEPSVDVTWKELRQRTGRFIQAFKAAGVQRGDRVAAVAGNGIDTLLVFLATTALGAIFTSTSTDTGIKGILDRLKQTKPAWVFMDDFTVYNGKTVDLRPKFTNVFEGLSRFQEFKGIVSLPRFRDRPADVSHLPRTQSLADFLAKASSEKLEFVRIGFRDPFLIVYSSGTTGEPKCIVHSVGGVTLNMFKEGLLHRDMDADSVVMQYTTTGWIMYLTSISVLFIGAKTILYDGSPFLPDTTILIKLLEKHG